MAFALVGQTGAVDGKSLPTKPVADPLGLVQLVEVMQLTAGVPEVVVALLDGPVDTSHPDFVIDHIRTADTKVQDCSSHLSSDCLHGTLIAGILHARRGSAAPAICPGCTLLVSPIFRSQGSIASAQSPMAPVGQVAEAIASCADAGARIVNLSAALSQASREDEQQLERALDHVRAHGALVVAAAGNDGGIGVGSILMRHPAVVPVVGYGLDGRITNSSNLSRSMAIRGVGAPAEGITSLAPNGGHATAAGTSAAAAFVTGALSLVWSLFPDASASQMTLAIRGPGPTRRRAIVPPLLDAVAANARMSSMDGSVLS